MKSSKEDLRRRGYIEDINIEKYTLLNKSEVLKLLDSKEARELIDAIGFLSFYNEVPNKSIIGEELIKYYEKN